jgi:uncharacterized protein YndB with AHSA1/START domain
MEFPMPAKSDEIHAGIRSDAVKAKTGKGWKEWFALLDKVGAAKWPHREIASYLHDECECPNWWSQMVTVGYEQARGLRVKHQTAGGFTAGASKTIDVPVTALFEAWSNSKLRVKWLPDATKIEIRSATQNRRLRIGWSDDSNLEVMFYAKGKDKSQVTIERRKLPNTKAVIQVKAYWIAALNKLKEMLETSPRKAAAKRAIKR